MFDGHLNIGKRITVYGDNAMHWGVTIWTKTFGFICFRLPFKSCGHRWPLYFYCSPDATPNMATFFIGKEYYSNGSIYSKYRRKLLGHNFDTNPGGIEYKLARLIPVAADISKGVYGDRCEWPEKMKSLGYNVNELKAVLKSIEYMDNAS